ncbi:MULTISPECIES: 1-phosphofructokinase [Spiroplasma]|uniref:1-phosphofructokinase n=1 Tax=Spiroplasma TaxID=2132 RepID=UPI0018DC5CB3|nr:MULTISPECIES: 1-phosphofructokinase [Spiroplasma]MBH8622667.1 1-phosphofructokinase [Spiroplasma sp. hyd1]UNF62484.1 1-phosphofructokinase [Spiroplasma poulsonii]
MIYTLTLNPAIDQIIEVPNFQLGETNKAVGEYDVIGGKGINVAVMLQHLGYPTTALGFLGRDNKEMFEHYLTEQQVPAYFHEVSGKTRTNMKIKSLETKQETELNGVAFAITDADVTTILTLIKAKVTKNDCLIISGSLPQHCDHNLYQIISTYCYDHQISFVVDATKDALLSTLATKPFLIKPNLAELNELFGTNYDFKQVTAIVALGQKLRAQGAQNVLISSGKDGSILITKHDVYLANTATGQLVNSVGAGDSMVAGFVGTYLATKDYQAALLMGICAGSATAFSPGIASRELVESLKPQITITIFK